MNAFSFSESQEAPDGTGHEVRSQEGAGKGEIIQSGNAKNTTIPVTTVTIPSVRNNLVVFVSTACRQRRMGTYHCHPFNPPVVTPLNAKARTPPITVLKYPSTVTYRIRRASSSGRYQ